MNARAELHPSWANVEVVDGVMVRVLSVSDEPKETTT